MRRLCIVISMAVVLFASCSSEPKATEPPAKAPDEAAAIEALKRINQAQADFIRRTRRYALTFDELIKDRLLDAEPTKAETGYDILLRPRPDAIAYTVIATPAGLGRHFFTDQTGALRAESNKPAGAESPAF